MARPPRLEFAGAFYHVTSRGDRREPIYEDDEDRTAFLNIFGTVIEDFDWVAHAYCLMGNHYHLLVETPDANLAFLSTAWCASRPPTAPGACVCCATAPGRRSPWTGCASSILSASSTTTPNPAPAPVAR